MSIMGISIPPMNQVIFAGVGFIAPPLVEGFLSSFLPASLTTSTIGKYATRIASVIGLSYLVKQIAGPAEARMVAIGGSVFVLSTVIAEFAPGMIPGLSAYVPAHSLGMGSYVRATGRTLNALPANGMGAAFTQGGISAVPVMASRYNRYAR
jgi:hypothetical protein